MKNLILLNIMVERPRNKNKTPNRRKHKFGDVCIGLAEEKATWK